MSKSVVENDIKFILKKNMNENYGLAEVELLVKNYNQYRKNRISLIATENITSNLSKATYLLGLCEQYCSRIPEDKDKVGNLSFGNLEAVDGINNETRNMLKKIFKVEECEARLLSGVNGLTVLLYTLLEQGDVLFKMSDLCGGHLSVKPIAEKLGGKVIEMEYNDDYVLDMKDFKLKYFKYKPKVIFLDSSYILFKYPVREIKEIVKDDAIIVYDASHVISYIANGEFQNPLEEGADIIHSTMHKIMFGPQKSVLLFKEKNELSQRMMNIVKDVLVSNTHLHHMLALYVALKEFEVFGGEYVKQLLSNNKYLAECLSQRDFTVLAKEQGYTESNQFWVKFKNEEESIKAFKRLEKINISTNVIFLPKGQWGLRLGTNELTRLGAGNDFFYKLAELMEDTIYEKENMGRLLEKRKKLSNMLKYQEIYYSFDASVEGKKLIRDIIDNFSCDLM